MGRMRPMPNGLICPNTDRPFLRSARFLSARPPAQYAPSSRNSPDPRSGPEEKQTATAPVPFPRSPPAVSPPAGFPENGPYSGSGRIPPQAGSPAPPEKSGNSETPPVSALVRSNRDADGRSPRMHAARHTDNIRSAKRISFFIFSISWQNNKEQNLQEHRKRRKT